MTWQYLVIAPKATSRRAFPRASHADIQALTAAGLSMPRTAACARITTLSKPRSRFDGRPRKFPRRFPIGPADRSALMQVIAQCPPWVVRGECRHARNASYAKAFRTRRFGLLVRRNSRRLSRGVFSVLRLHPLLRPVRLQLCRARPVRSPALRAAGKLLYAPCLLRFRLSPGADHGAISAGNGDRPDAVSF